MSAFARALAPAMAAGLLAACAAGPAAVEEAHKPPALAAYAANPFVPINLYLNANEHIAGQPAALIEYAGQRLHASGAFVRVDRGVQRWPITLQGRYRLEPVGSAADRARRAISWLTLGLVPVRIAKVHKLDVEIFEEPETVATLELAITVPDRVSLYDLGDPDRDERAAIDALLERMMVEIATRKLVPRWSEFKTEPPKKRAPKLPGRAT